MKSGTPSRSFFCRPLLFPPAERPEALCRSPARPSPGQHPSHRPQRAEADPVEKAGLATFSAEMLTLGPGSALLSIGRGWTDGGHSLGLRRVERRLLSISGLSEDLGTAFSSCSWKSAPSLLILPGIRAAETTPDRAAGPAKDESQIIAMNRFPADALPGDSL